MDRIRAIKQHDQSDCGAACLGSIAAAYGYHQPISKIREMASTEKNGTNVMGLVEAAEKMGFLARGIKGAPEALKSAPVPSIAHIKTIKNLHHFVVLTRIGKQFVKFMDPEYGHIRKVSYEESQEWWPEPVEPPAGAPNVIIFLLDDTGFAQIGSFGGLIETPNIDRLAANGLRYNNFHTTALCSPTRASLMAGRR